MLMHKILLGVTLAAPIGPVVIEMVRRGLQGGFMPAFSVRLGGAIANTICLLLSFFGLSFIVENKMMLQTLGAGGALILILMGILAIKNYKNIKLQTDGSKLKTSNGMKIGFVLAMFSPVGVAFWLSVFTADFAASASMFHSTLYELFQDFYIILGILLWGALLSLLLELGKKFINPISLRYVNLIAGMCMCVFGVKYLLMILA